MVRHNQIRLIFHSSLVMLISMGVATPWLIYLLGYTPDEVLHHYMAQAHAVCMATGIWMLAIAAVLPLLDLAPKFMAALVWSLIISIYAFLVAIGLFIVGIMIYHPDATKPQLEQLKVALPHHLYYVNLILLFVSGTTSLVAGLCVLGGAYNWMTSSASILKRTA